MRTDISGPEHPDTGREPSRAVIRFLLGWQETQGGDIRPGGTLVVDYNPERLPHCHTNWQGADIWDISVCIRFHPGGHLSQGSVLEELATEQHFVYGHRPRPFEITVPADASQIELWFHTSYQLTSFCEAWDSRFGQNYWFNVTR